MRCRWNRGKTPLFPGAYSVYASNGHRILALKSAGELAALQASGEASAPYRGVYTIVEFADLQSVLEAPVAVETSGNYVHWTAKGVKPVQ